MAPGARHNKGPNWDAEEEADNAAIRAEAEKLAGLQDLSIEQVIQAGHEALLRKLVAQAQAGSISHQNAAILRNMLRDNGMTLGVPPTAPPGEPARLPQDLPELEEPDYGS